MSIDNSPPGVQPDATPTPAQITPPPAAPTDDQAAAPLPTDTETPPAAEGSDDAGDQPRDAKGRFAKRTEQLHQQIGQLTAEKRSIQREVAMLNEQAARLRASLEKPDPIDPSDYAAQDEARTRRAVKAERLDQVQDELAERQIRAHELRKEAFLTKAEAVRERLPDIDQALQQFAALPVSQAAADVIADSEKGVEIAYWMAKNPQEARRIHALPFHLQAAEIARIEGRVSSNPVRRISQAPPPVQTVSGGVGSPGVNLETASFADYEKARAAEILGRS